MPAARQYSVSDVLGRSARRLDNLRPLLAETAGIVGESEALRHVMHRVDRVAPTEATVLLSGETGTGKELLARAIHRRGRRSDRPFVVINCAALPASLIESELFGHERGAFTGAHAGQIGRFELAHRGTVFLDEVGELPLELQSRLLRVIQEGQLERLGNPHTIDIDVRVIAATNRDLADEVRRGQFRRDLYYRLNVFPIAIPPLRERPGDIPPLARYLVERLGKALGRRMDDIPPEVMRVLEDYHWPGNVRELENVLHCAIIVCQGSACRSTMCRCRRSNRRHRSRRQAGRRRATPYRQDPPGESRAHRGIGRRGANPRPEAQHAAQPDVPAWDFTRALRRSNLAHRSPMGLVVRVSTSSRRITGASRNSGRMPLSV